MVDRIPELRRTLDQGGDFMVPAGEEKIAWMAMIQAQRAMTDILERVAKRQDEQDGTMKEVAAALHSIDKRLVVMENNSLGKDVTRNAGKIEAIETQTIPALDKRIMRLETREHERDGASKFADALLKYGPFAIALVTALFLFLVATKKVVL